jgi:AcrR family transcriptional regulator
MGRRSKADLYNQVERILQFYSRDKMTIQEIADQLQAEGIDMSRESVRRSLKSSKDLALELRTMTEEARVMMEAVKDSPNTDIAEAVVTRFAGLMLREVQELDSVEFEDPGEAALAIGRIANAQAKLGTVRMKYQSGFEAAKKAVLTALQRELKANHPDVLERLTMLVGALEAPSA